MACRVEVASRHRGLAAQLACEGLISRDTRSIGGLDCPSKHGKVTVSMRSTGRSTIAS